MVLELDRTDAVEGSWRNSMSTSKTLLPQAISPTERY